MTRLSGTDELTELQKAELEETRKRNAAERERVTGELQKEQATYREKTDNRIGTFRRGLLAAGNLPVGRHSKDRSPSAGGSAPVSGKSDPQRIKAARLYLEIEAPAHLHMPETVWIHFVPLGLAGRDGYLFELLESEAMHEKYMAIVRQDHPFAAYVEDVPEDVIQFVVPDSVPVDEDAVYRLQFKVEQQVDEEIHVIGEREVRFWKIYANGTSFPYRWEFALAEDGAVARCYTHELDMFELMPLKR
ncbi:MAG: hypothetical protein AAF787_03870 [Chloroflexota bacterium]